MKASTFIQTALIDQMQQIADLGLWFHLAKLIPSGVEVLARVTYCGYDDGMVFGPNRIEYMVEKFYKEYFPEGYAGKYSDSKEFFSAYPSIFLSSAAQDADNHLKVIEPSEKGRNQKSFLHVPQWFADFKAACKIVLHKIEAGELQDIEVLKTVEE